MKICNHIFQLLFSGGAVWQLDLQLPMQSVPITTTNIVSSNPLSRGVLNTNTTLFYKVCQ